MAALVLVAGGVLLFRVLTSGDAGQGDGSSVNESASNVQVTLDENGRTVVSNVEGDGFQVTFVIPQNCTELTSLVREEVAAVSAAPPPEQIRRINIYQTLAEDLCTTRQFRVLILEVLSPFYESIGASSAMAPSAPTIAENGPDPSLGEAGPGGGDVSQAPGQTETSPGPAGTTATP